MVFSLSRYLSTVILSMSMAIHNLVSPVAAKEYRVKNILDQEIMITGRGDHPLWMDATAMTDFIYPWEKEVPGSVTFKAMHNKQWLYCLFIVRDAPIKVYQINNEKSEVIKSDRVEIFFRKDDRLSPYYCIEMDPLARIYDYEAEYHRHFNTDWSWPTGQLVVKAHQYDGGYTVEIAIHKDSLHQLGLLKANRIEAGLYRAECVEIKDSVAEMKWISWIKPLSETPDFHIASSFGVLLLENERR